MYGGCPRLGRVQPAPITGSASTCTDTGDVGLGPARPLRGTDPKDDVHYDDDDIAVVDDPGTEPDAVISGDAATLDAWLWRRGDGATIHLAGDLEIVDHFRQVIHHPIN